MKKLTSLLLALAVILSLAVPAFAAASTVEYYGHKLFDFDPGSEYTKTDLFDNFKDVMPGDTLKETVTIKNTAKCCDYIKVYIRAVPHGTGNAISKKVLEELTADERRKEETELQYMKEFLSQLDLTVKDDGKTIFSGKASELDGLKKKVYVAKLTRGKTETLKVELTVPAEMGNEFANRIGEVDWEFTVEEYDYKSESPKTGDHMAKLLVPCILAMGISAAGLIFLLILKRKKNKNQ